MNRDKQTSCNLPAARYESISEITRIEIQRSCIFTDKISLALPQILYFIQADKPNQMSWLAHQRITAHNDQ